MTEIQTTEYSSQNTELKNQNILIFAHGNTYNLIAIEEALAKIISDKTDTI